MPVPQVGYAGRRAVSRLERHGMPAATTRRVFLATAAAALLTACGTRHPRRRPVPRIGFMIGSAFPEMTAAFEDELRRLGYIDGESIIVERRFTGGDRAELGRHAQELARMDLDAIVAAALPQLLALRDAGSTTPTVVGTAPGIVENGFASSMERPDRNVTGLDELPRGLTGRRLEWLKRFAPAVRRVALLSTTPGVAHATQLADAEATASRLGVAVRAYRAGTPAEVTRGLEQIARDGNDALLSFQGGLALGLRRQIVDFANGHGLPAVYQSRLFVEAGGLLSLAPDQNEQFRFAARYVDRILRGAAIEELPIRHPDRYYLALNRATAAQLGLEPAPELLAEVDELVG